MVDTPADKEHDGFSNAYLCELARKAARDGVPFGDEKMAAVHLYSQLADRIEALSARSAVVASGDMDVLWQNAMKQSTGHADESFQANTITKQAFKDALALFAMAQAARSTHSATERTDAARYRWLRHDTKDVRTEKRKAEIVEVYQGPALDEWIDKMMAKENATDATTDSRVTRG